MTQKERILAMLKAHGSDGVRSDLFIKNFMPRAAARVQELKDEGHDISSEREGKYVRWTLSVGVESGDTKESQPKSSQGLADSRGATLDSGVADSVTPLPEAPPANFYANEVWAA